MREVIVEKDRAAGVVLENGETIRAKYVAANVNPKLLYTRLLPAGALAPEFLTRMRRWRNGSGTFRMNVALSQLPRFTALPGDGDHLTAGIILAPSLAYMDRAYHDARDAWLEPRADRRDADPLHPRRHAGARRARMSRACSASTSRPNCRMANPGTTIARKSPTS